MKKYVIAIGFIIFSVWLYFRWDYACRDIHHYGRYCNTYQYSEIERKIVVCGRFIPNGFNIDLTYRASASVYDLNNNLLGYYDIGEEYFDSIGDNGDPNIHEGNETFDLGWLAQNQTFRTTPFIFGRMEAKVIEGVCGKQ
ncbi:hypothetical protein [uncultured Actinobacillus sp.]|uniref:hypothetical protein n=1 Tax=uncultured Actinobacillus sp. TaxID=417616 RepID=UPI0025E288D7|nr:hypothetical protein [uncultured Actinobacillus sp.]